jgi:hypothetical protein
MMDKCLMDHAYNFVDNIQDDELYARILKSENIGWPLIMVVAKGFVSIDGLTEEGRFYVKCTYDALIEYGMEA